jgi:HPt (histidine-containing phosphotransfer) domain-containing protein
MTDKDLAEIKIKIDEWAAQCDREFAARLIETFLTDVPKRLTTLRRAFEQGAQDEFKRAAHTLKSSSGQLGISFYAEVAMRVELASREGRMAEMAESVSWLEIEFTSLREGLQTLRTSYAGAPAN